MLALRSKRELLVTPALAAILGFVVVTAAERFGGYKVALLILLSPLLLLCGPLALRQAADKLRSLARQFVWWQGLWVLLFLSGLVFRTRDSETIREGPIDFWAMYRVLLVAFVVPVLSARIFLGKTRFPRPWLDHLFSGPAGAMAVYTLIAIGSTLWSVYPAWTLYKSSELFVDYALMASILTHARSIENFKSLYDWTWALCIGCLVTIWAGVILWPEEALLHDVGLLGVQIQGVVPAISANGVGDIGAVVAIIALDFLTIFRPAAPKCRLRGNFFLSGRGDGEAVSLTNTHRVRSRG